MVYLEKMESPDKSMELAQVNLNEIPEHLQRVVCDKPSLLLSTPKKKIDDFCLFDQEASPVLESSFFKDQDSKQFKASTPANVLQSADSSACKSDSVLEILDRLCSPIHKKSCSGSSFSKFKRTCGDSPGSVPSDRSSRVQQKLKKHKKRLLCDASESKVENNYSKKRKLSTDQSHKTADINESKVTNDIHFKQHDISENTLQIICDMTENIVEEMNSDHLKLKKLNVQGVGMTETCGANNFGLDGGEFNENQRPPLNDFAGSNMCFKTQLCSDGGVSIYSSVVSHQKPTTHITMKDLLISALVLEEGNKCQKLERSKEQETITANECIKKSALSKALLEQSLNDYMVCSNEFKKQSIKCSALDSSTITDTQFCEALEAVEMVKDLDLTLNKFSFEPNENNSQVSEECNISNGVKSTTCLDEDAKTKFDDLKNTECPESQTQEESLKTFKTSEKTVENTSDPGDKIIQRNSNINDFLPLLKSTIKVQDKSTNHYKTDTFSESETKLNVLQTNKSEQESDLSLEKEQKSNQNCLNKLNSQTPNLEKEQVSVKDCLTENQSSKRRSDVFFEKDRNLLEDKSDVSARYSACVKFEQKFDNSPNKSQFFKVQPETKLFMKGFQTASGKNIQILENSISEARKLFEDESEEKIELNSFYTGCSQFVGVSEDLLNKVLKGETALNKDITGLTITSGKSVPLSEKTEADNILVDRLEKKKEFHRFQMASSKNVVVSKDPLNRTSEELHEDTKNNLKCFQVACKQNEPKNYTRKLLGKSHKTKEIKVVTSVSGNFVQFSKEAFKKGRRLLEDGDEPKTEIKVFQRTGGKFVQTPEESLVKTRQVSEGKLTSEFNGFQTASGKSVKTSEESLKRARKLFQGECEPATELKGFQTASGKSVKTSEESLKRARKLVQDECEPATELKGFQTASGKSVKTSEESLKRARKLVQDEGELATEFKGFQTASGKSVKASEESMKRARKLFEDECELTSEFNGFQTASGKSVRTSEESLKKARKLFQDECEPATEFKGFQTASGKGVKTSEESLKRARKLFEDECELTSELNGFQTASGKSVKTSEESLKIARTLFEDEGELKEEIKGFQMTSSKSVKMSEDFVYKGRSLFEDKINTEIKGFQTVSGKSVQISEESLKIGRKLFEDEGEPKTEIKGFQPAVGKFVQSSEESLQRARKVCEGGLTTEFKGFQTASGKSVKTSEESLKRARKIFEDEVNIEIKGFQSASGKVVKTSETSLKRARELFEDEGELKPIIGLQTASGKCVEISGESLNLVKRLFEGEHEIKTNGFQTAAGKSVQISEAYLKKERKLFEDENISKLNEIQTASETNLEITTKSLRRARKLLNNNIKQNKQIKVFQTAIGASVQMSRDSLDKAKLLLQEKVIPETETTVLKECNSKNIKTPSSLKNKQQYKDQNQPDYNIIDIQNGCEKYLSEPEILQDSNSLSVSSSNSLAIDEITSPVLGKKNISKDYNVLDESGQLVENYDSCSLPLPAGTLKFKTPTIQRKLIFSPMSCKKHNGNNTQQYDSNIVDVTKTSSSVISEDDLSLLNHSLTNLKKNLNSSRVMHEELDRSQERSEEVSELTPDVAHEVSESMAALMADEQSKSPFCRSLLLKSLQTSPTMMFDRDIKLPTIYCDDKSAYLNEKPSSPVLDAYSRLKPNQFLKKCALDFSTLENECMGKGLQISTPISTGSFKPPYATSTPNENVSTPKSKRKWQGLKYFKSDRKCTTPAHDVEYSLSHESGLANIVEARKVAVEKQEKAIQDKMSKNVSIKPCKGSYLLRVQTEKRKTLRDLTGGQPLQVYSEEQLLKLGVEKAVIELTARNVEDFKFNAVDYYCEETVNKSAEGLPVGDGVRLIVDEAGQAGVEELTRGFLAGPAVAPLLLPPGWVQNHLRWILLKLAASQRRFPHLRLLTPNNVMLQLKYRYDREIDRCERPALRKILEKDESPAKTMILFVADVHKVECGGVELELSDGWYSARASVDHEMQQLVRRGLVTTGTKLMTQGAELINCGDGCHPLQAPPEVRLKIWSNSTRRARWYARLGFCRDSLPPLTLRGVFGRGGAIQALSACVVRTYPLLYREKTSDGVAVVRGEKEEESAGELYQQRRQQCAEFILARLQEEFTIDSEEALSKGSGSIEEQMEERSMKMQQLIQEKLMKELDEKIPSRNVSRMLKVRLADVEIDDDRSAVLTLWNPNEQLLTVLSEGSHLVFYALTASGYSRYGEVQLSTNRQTRFSPQPGPGSRSKPQSSRTTTSLESLRHNYKAAFSEIDVVGMVLPLDCDNPNTVYIADDNYNFLGISFRVQIKDSGHSKLLQPGRVVAVSNLRWHAHLVSWNLPTAFATEVTGVSQHPRQSHLQPALQHLSLRLQALDLANYMEECLERIISLIVHRNSAGTTPRPLPGESKAMSDSTDASSSAVSTPVGKPDGSTDNVSVETPTNRKIAWLERFGEPPPLSPLALNTPVRLRRSFRPPLKKNSSKSDNR